MNIGYARVSTGDQTTEAQMPALEAAQCSRIYEEQGSGKNKDRPQLAICLARLKKGDTLVVWRLDRLGRSIRDLLEITADLEKRGVNFRCLAENFDTTTASGRLVFHFFAALAEFERGLIRERTLAGLTAARARGRMGGRKRKLSRDQANSVKILWNSNEMTKAGIAEQYGVSIATIDRIVRPQPLKA